MNIFWCHEKNENYGLFVKASTRGRAKAIFSAEIECDITDVRTNIMRRGKILLILAVCTMILSGCSMKFSAEENAVYVNKDGEIVSAIVESFDKDYYDAEELQDMLEQE